MMLVKTKTEELSGPALDWAIATIQGLPIQKDPMGFHAGLQSGYWVWHDGPKGPFKLIGAIRYNPPPNDPAPDLAQAYREFMRRGESYSPSSDPVLAHQIIESEGIATRRHSSGTWFAMSRYDTGDLTRVNWSEFTHLGGERGKPRRKRFSGRTMLEAAMRCYVAWKLGATIEVPGELLELERRPEGPKPEAPASEGSATEDAALDDMAPPQPQ